jgi:cobyrinic acid a,c-diamide synthase
MKQMTKAILISGTHSGVGKTTITVGLIDALRRAGHVVQPFKVGPDYIDPTYHSLAAGRPCRNLDTWMMSPDQVQTLFVHANRGADVAIIEGAMGLYDGIGYDNETGSTAQIAKLLSCPVILVMDVAKQARSAAALAMGYQKFDSKLDFAGIILNRVGSDGHGAGIAKAVQTATGINVLGWLPRDNSLQIAERHLGLIPTMEPGRWWEYCAAAGKMIEKHIKLAAAIPLAALRSPKPSSEREAASGVAWPQNSLCVIAVAHDEAFHFTYEENLELLRQAGAEIVYFSPLHDQALPAGTAGVVLSGGFPELFAAQLASNSAMLDAIRQAHADDLPIYAECGGLMYLTEAIIDLDGRRHVMAGLLPGNSVMSGKLTLGYRRIQPADNCCLLDQGESAHGHEFHYSSWADRPANLPPAYWIRSATGSDDPRPEGARLGNLIASYVHLHFWGKPELAQRFVHACQQVKAGVP